MASSATITIAAQVSGLPTGSKALSFSYGPITGAVAETLDTALVSGNNTITIPAGATWLFIEPPTGNTVALTLGGLALDLTRVTVYPIPAGTASVVINAASGVTPELSFL